jgi:SAM-dependent methyltransferase
MYKSRPLKVDSGVDIFSEKDSYWGILPKPEMTELIRLIESRGFDDAIREFDYKGRRFDYAQDTDRSDFIYFLPLSKKTRVLDLGSGFGNVTIPLAKQVKHVVAADMSFELLNFSRMRARAEGVENISYAKIDPLEEINLPFSHGSFDLIVLNGVLEWIGNSLDHGNPRELQLAVLKELRNLLSDNGVLYIGIENRLFPGWIRRDPHSKLKYTSILPRFLANWYAKREGIKNGYRTYIYSKWGYDDLLNKAGFAKRKYYYPHTSYRAPDIIISDEALSKEYFYHSKYFKIFTKKWRGFLTLLKPLGLDVWFYSSFMIVAAKEEHVDLKPFVLESESQNDFRPLAGGDCLIKVTDLDSKKRLLLSFGAGQSAPSGECEI